MRIDRGRGPRVRGYRLMVDGCLLLGILDRLTLAVMRQARRALVALRPLGGAAGWWPVILALLLAASFVGCGSAPTSPSADQDGADSGAAVLDEIESGTEVPDASYGDGADAVDAVESEGLTAVLVDANDDYSFDSYRDATGCEVIDQDPAAGEVVDDGDEVEVTVDCAQVDWENHEGAGWDAFNDAYAVAFDDGCQALFHESPDGSLYEDDYEYTVVDCQNLNLGDASDSPDLPGDAPDDPEETGTELGELDGCRALFEEGGVYSLNWGTHSITEDECPIGTYVPSARPQTKKRKKRQLTDDTCTAEQAGGTPISIEIERGQINCAGAEALWNDFLRRAPTEGQGSSGVMEIDGWICAGALMTDAPRAGSCARTDKSAEFVVYDGE